MNKIIAEEYNFVSFLSDKSLKKNIPVSHLTQSVPLLILHIDVMQANLNMHLWSRKSGLISSQSDLPRVFFQGNCSVEDELQWKKEKGFSSYCINVFNPDQDYQRIN